MVAGEGDANPVCPLVDLPEINHKPEASVVLGHKEPVHAPEGDLIEPPDDAGSLQMVDDLLDLMQMKNNKCPEKVL